MASLVEDLHTLERESLSRLSGTSDEKGLEEWRVAVLGRRGELAERLKGLATLAPEERPAAGAAGNRVKGALEAAFSERQRSLRALTRERELEAERIDVTLPGRGYHRGLLHPITRIRREIEAIFVRLGFTVVEGPEVEYDRYNFTLLNMPEDHPSRDAQDTFYVANVGGTTASGTPEVLLRTHTSPVQIRTMLAQPPPIRVIIPGRAYRNEATDAAHETQFSQVEGLCVDEHVTMGDLRGSLTFMIRSLFGEARQVRFRCGYFPFVEPGAEFDMSCHICDGTGGRTAKCSTCKGTGWIEIGGCGMVHPVVLENCGLDPQRYSGWAFGFGFERMALVRYGVDDVRLFYTNDLRFLQQFK